MIDDEYQDKRIKWILGKPTLAVSLYYKKIMAVNSSFLDERTYHFDSTLYIEGGTSLLEILFANYKKI